ncbi:MAG: hypothetical protein M3068_13895 [Gemmatimonadota bacterium]|nr:hypothetical protein [Gemmatimonadota bacterium]
MSIRMIVAVLLVILGEGSAQITAAQAVPDSVIRPLHRDSLPATRCAGERVSTIELRPARPPFKGAGRFWRTAGHAVGLHHATTRNSVLAAFLDLEPGQPCTEFRRAESERVLRAQPFLANASVTVFPDTGGTVRIVVETTDEIPVVVGGRLHGSRVAALSLGNENIAGLGLSVLLSAQRGAPYRNGFGAEVVDYATGGRPYVSRLAAVREPLGGRWQVGLSHPFFTDLQRRAWHASASGSHVFLGFLRPAHDGLALDVRRQGWELGALGRAPVLSRFGIGGLVVTGSHLAPGADAVVLSDSGMAPDTGVTLSGRYQGFRAVRLGGIAGIRGLTFRTVRGFDALTALQDVAVGAQLGVLLAHGVGAFGASDLFVASELYTGFGGERSFFGLQVDAEARHEPAAQGWDDILMSGRGAWYMRGGKHTLILSDEISGGRRSRLPFQLSAADRDGGIRGYRSSLIAGGWRSVARMEDRLFLTQVRGRLDFGMAGFADVGSIWAGDAPYGQTKLFEPSLGFSLLGAFPVGSKRLYRVDVAFPTGPGAGGRWEVRFSSEDRTRAFWTEPGDILRSRTNGTPSALFNWPLR